MISCCGRVGQLVIFLPLTLWGRPVFASVSPKESSRHDDPRKIDADSLKSFFDESVPDLMERVHAAGMVVSAVHDGKVAFKKGYGYANIQEKTEVDPDKTLFRIASISKLFVWTAVLQLVERGQLDLDEDINTYLKLGGFQIAETFKEPITLSHIMSHTDGFEDWGLFNLFIKDPEKQITNEQAIKGKKLRRVRRPGEEISYSNYGCMVAGYIVQLISGMPFETYVDERIFKPLGMNHSTFRQPLPVALQSYASEGYAYNGNTTVRRDYEIVQGVPAGAASSSAWDMAKFLLAHLSPDRSMIFKEQKTLELFHTTLYRPNPRAKGVAHGLMELDFNDQQVLGHGGDTIYFHSLWFIVPKQHVGVFFSVNTGLDYAMVQDTVALAQAFMSHFFPSPTGRERAREFKSCTDISLYPGDYLANQRSESDMSKLLSLSMNMKVRRTENNTLRIANCFMQETLEYIEVEPGIFQEVDGCGRVAFMRNDEGAVKGLIWTALPVITFKRPPFWELPALNIAIVTVTAILVLCGLFLRPFGLSTLLFKNKTVQPEGATAATRLGFAVALIYTLFVPSVILAVDSDFVFAGDPPMAPFLIPWVAFFLGLLLPFYAYLAWKRGFWGRAGRVFYSVFAFDVQVFFWQLWYWNVAAHF